MYNVSKSGAANQTLKHIHAVRCELPDLPAYQPFWISKMAPQIDKKNHDTLMFGAIWAKMAPRKHSGSIWYMPKHHFS